MCFCLFFCVSALGMKRTFLGYATGAPRRVSQEEGGAESPSWGAPLRPHPSQDQLITGREHRLLLPLRLCGKRCLIPQFLQTGQRWVKKGEAERQI